MFWSLSRHIKTMTVSTFIFYTIGHFLVSCF
jgi:hypothetical protein